MTDKKKTLRSSPKVKVVFKIFMLIFVVLTFISLYYNSKVTIELSVQNATLNEMMTINIDVKKGSNYVEVDSLKIALQHKYKKDEKLTTNLTPYADGRYQLYYYPQIQGDYLVDVKATKGDKKFYENTTIEVE